MRGVPQIVSFLFIFGILLNALKKNTVKSNWKNKTAAGRKAAAVFVLYALAKCPPAELERVKKLSLPASSEAGRDEQLYDCQKDNLVQTAPVYRPQGK